jgi:uroporphyrinogen decarboxylase
MTNEIMTSKERVLCALGGEMPDRIPFVEPGIEPAAAAALFGDEHAHDSCYISEKLGMDIVSFRLMPQLFVEEVELSQGRKHQTTGKLHKRSDLALMEQLKDPFNPSLYKELDELLDRNAGQRAVCGCSRLGISSMLMSMDLTGFSYALMDDPELVVDILRRYLQWSAVAEKEMTKRGVDLLWFYDDMAYCAGPMMSPQVFRDMILLEVKKVTDDLTLPWVYHSDGDLRPVLDDLLTLGMSGLNPIEPESLSLVEMKQLVGDRVCLIGNVSVDKLARGTESEMREEVARCFREGSPGGRYMISSSNSIPEFARPENVLTMANEISEQNKIYMKG